MKIRPATHDDINRVVELGISVWSETRYSDFNFDIDKVWSFISTYIEYEDGIVLVAENDDGYIIGGLLAEVFTHFFGHTKAAMDLTIFIDPRFRGSPAIYKLIKRYKTVAKELGAEDIMIGISSNLKIEQAGKMFSRLGFKQVGSLFNLESA